MLRRILSALDPDTPPAAAWLREGWPRALPIVIVCVLPTFVAAPIWVITGAPPKLSLVLAIGLVIALLVPLRSAWAARPARVDGRALVAHAVPALLACVSVALLHNRDFSGLPSYQGADGNVALDAAQNLLYGVHFTRSQGDVYSGLGFASLFAFWDAVRSLRADWVLAANLSFQLGVIVVAAAPSVIVFALLGRHETRAFVVGAAVCLVAGLLAAWYVLLPLEAVGLVSGFWPQLFALIPLVALWLTDVLVRPRIVRVAGILVFAALYRYTYALNLPELALTVAAILVADLVAPALPRPARLAGGVAAIATLLLARSAFLRLVPLVIGRFGWRIPQDMAIVWRGQLLGVAALAAGMIFWPARDRVRGSGIVRALRFPALFALSSAIVFALFRRQPGGEHAYLATWADYYFQKHDTTAAIFATSGIIVLLSFAAAEAVALRSRRVAIAAALAGALALTAQWQVQRGFAAYRDVLAEIAFGKPPYARLRPWVDVEALGRMERELRARGAAFGGFVAHFYPMAAFVNATQGRGEGPLWKAQPLDASPGHCVFWEGGALPAADAQPRKRCERYHARWEPNGTERALCAVCF